MAVLLELAADLEEVVLGVVEQDQPLGRHARDLARELGADRPARAGDEHDLAREVGAHALELHAHGLAAEHVLDLHRAQLRTMRPPVRSSSKTVGSVRTAMPRSRQAETTRARSVPGAEGMAMMTSPGSTSSRIRGRSALAPSTLTPCSRRMPRLRGSSSTKPTGR